VLSFPYEIQEAAATDSADDIVGLSFAGLRRGSAGPGGLRGGDAELYHLESAAAVHQAEGLVIDPCAGSGTTLDVARDLNRRALGYDLKPTRKDIFRVDARKLPLENGKADFVFIDPPYSRTLIIRRSALHWQAGRGRPEYYKAMEQVIGEIHRVLRPGGHMGLYVCDSFVKGRDFSDRFELFAQLRKRLEAVDIVAVVRHNKTLEMGIIAPRRRKEFLSAGFNYLFIMRKAR